MLKYSEGVPELPLAEIKRRPEVLMTVALEWVLLQLNERLAGVPLARADITPTLEAMFLGCDPAWMEISGVLTLEQVTDLLEAAIRRRTEYRIPHQTGLQGKAST